MAVLQVPCFCLVTGASRGIGRGIALQLAEKVGDNSLLVLTARSDEGLRETRRCALAGRSTGIEVRTVTADLGALDSLPANLTSLFAAVDRTKFEHSILIHNAASLGDPAKLVRQMNNPQELQDYFGLNLTSAICMTSKFLEIFKPSAGRRISVINVSSGAAHRPMRCLSTYCSAKVAREMLFKVLAAEEPSVRVLNYGPGHVDTDMHRHLRHNTGDPDMKYEANTAFASGKILTPVGTAETLIKILEDDCYENGNFVTVYDYV